MRDVGVAEELAQDALVAALEQWPTDGRARQPGRVAHGDREAPRDRHAAPPNAARAQARCELGRERGDRRSRSPTTRTPSDSTTRSATTCCGSSSSRAIRCSRPRRASRSRCGCSAGSRPTRSRARSWCPSRRSRSGSCARSGRSPTRRCRSRCRAARELAARLASVLEVIYLIFNEGYSATAGDDWLRPALCEDALRLGRILAGLAPSEPEVHGLVALMEIQASRARARVGPDGRADPAARAGPRALGSAADPPRPRGARARRARSAAGARAVHAAGRDRRLPRARARRPRRPTGRGSRRSTARSPRSTPSPVVELNRAVAVAMADGPAAGLALVDALRDEPALRGYHLLPSVRGDLLAQARPARRGGARRVRARRGAHAQRARAGAAAALGHARAAPGESTDA